MPESTIHYSSTMPIPSSFKSQGQGECGGKGYISGWHGVVNCKKCLKIIAQEKCKSFVLVKGDL